MGYKTFLYGMKEGNYATFAIFLLSRNWPDRALWFWPNLADMYPNIRESDLQNSCHGCSSSAQILQLSYMSAKFGQNPKMSSLVSS